MNAIRSVYTSFFPQPGIFLIYFLQNKETQNTLKDETTKL